MVPVTPASNNAPHTSPSADGFHDVMHEPSLLVNVHLSCHLRLQSGQSNAKRSPKSTRSGCGSRPARRVAYLRTPESTEAVRVDTPAQRRIVHWKEIAQSAVLVCTVVPTEETCGHPPRSWLCSAHVPNLHHGAYCFDSRLATVLPSADAAVQKMIRVKAGLHSAHQTGGLATA